MNRVLAVGLVCLLACAQTGWCNGSSKPAPTKDCSEGFVNIIVDIVTAPCSLLAACLNFGVENLPFSSSSMRCAPPRTPKKVSKSSREDIAPGKSPGEPLPSTKRTATQSPGEPLPSTKRTATQSPPETDSRLSSPTVRIETYVPQEKPASSGSASPVPVPRQAAGEEEPTVVQPGQELLEKIPGDNYRPPKANVEAKPSSAKAEQLSPSKIDQPEVDNPKTAKPKSEKSRKGSYRSPCMPVYPAYPCVPGPFFR
jgi:hypothetical protein